VQIYALLIWLLPTFFGLSCSRWTWSLPTGSTAWSSSTSATSRWASSPSSTSCPATASGWFRSSVQSIAPLPSCQGIYWYLMRMQRGTYNIWKKYFCKHQFKNWNGYACNIVHQRVWRFCQKHKFSFDLTTLFYESRAAFLNPNYSVKRFFKKKFPQPDTEDFHYLQTFLKARFTLLSTL